MKTCFVIQPFNEEHNKRYKNVVKPAIEEVGYESYRVDEDKAVQKPIESIEQKIRECSVCFADISDDNPNVWYEVGFATALGKKMILACACGRDKYPFDIQHRNIIAYQAGTTQGHKKLKKEIIDRLEALEISMG